VKKKAKYTKPNKTATEKLYEDLPKPIPPMSLVMVNPLEKRKKKFDYKAELESYD
jgi:hypothetical protein